MMTLGDRQATHAWPMRRRERKLVQGFFLERILLLFQIDTRRSFFIFCSSLWWPHVRAMPGAQRPPCHHERNEPNDPDTTPKTAKARRRESGSFAV